MLRTLGLGRTYKEADVAMLFDYIDADGSGMIDVGEFVQGLMDVPGGGGGADGAAADGGGTAELPPEIAQLRLPVDDASNTADAGYCGSYVCEVSLCPRVQGMLERSERLKKMNAKLRVARARVKRYQPGTPHPSGAHAGKHAKALDKLHKLQAKRVVLLHAIADKALREEADSDSDSEAEAPRAAFVVFNHEASADSCVEDYKKSFRFGWCGLRKRLQATPLRLKRHDANPAKRAEIADGTRTAPRRIPLRVKAATGATNVQWENINMSDSEGMLRRSATNVVTILIMLVSFFLIYYGSLKKQEFAAKVPNNAVCALLATVSRPDLAAAVGGDAGACGTRGGSQGYLVGFGADVAAPVGAAAAAAAAALNASAVACPASGLACVWPDGGGGTQGCAVAGSGDAVSAAELRGCACQDEMDAATARSGMVSGAAEVYDDPMCTEFVSTFVIAYTMLIAASFSVIVVNLAMKQFMKALVEWERHEQKDDELRSLCTKMFAGQFMNTALLMILINAKLPSGLTSIGGIFSFTGLMTGAYDDFRVGWYSDVGGALTLTMVINMVAPHCAPLLMVFVITPLKRWAKRGKALTQRELDNLYTGPEFGVAVRAPYCLNTIYVTYAFCGALPVLLPICCVSLLLQYTVDKLCLIKLCRRPPKYDADLARLMGESMWTLVVLHLVVSMWPVKNLQRTFLD